MLGKRIVVLGAGVGGLVAAHRLRRLLSREHQVTLVDHIPWHTFAPSLSWVMTGNRDPRRIMRDLRPLSKKGIELRLSEVSGIDFEARKVRLEDKEVEYDYLIISLGADYSSHQIPGLNKAWTYYHIEGAEGLRDELRTFQGGRVAVVVSALPYKCPVAPYEGAFLLDRYFHRRKMREDVHIQVITPEPLPLPVAGERAGEKVVELLGRRQIDFVPQMWLRSVDQQKKTMSFEGGAEMPFDLLVATPIHNVPAVLVASGLVQEGGWVEVDRETMATAFEDVYAIGDSTAIPLANGMMLPKAGVFAQGQAEVVAQNIAAEIEGSNSRWAFGGQGGCFLESGGGKAAFATGNFYAEPQPDVDMRGPSRVWHWSKVGFERMWLRRWF